MKAYASCGSPGLPVEISDITNDAAEVAFRAQLQANNSLVNSFCGTSSRWINQARRAEANDGWIERPSTTPGPHPIAYPGRRYFGCRSDVTWMNRVQSGLCQNGNVRMGANLSGLGVPHVPGHFVFMFDGFGDFNASAGANMGASNLSGDEGNDFGGRANGLGLFGPAVSRAFPVDTDVHIQYHASSGLKRQQNIDVAEGCAEQLDAYDKILQMLVPARPKAKWAAIGYSNGGDRSLAFEDRLNRKGIALDLLLTVDPITQYGDFALWGSKEFAGERSESTVRAVNFYQNSDRNSAPLISLQGKPVRGADENVLINADDSAMLSTGDQNHVRILMSQRVKDGIGCELQNFAQVAQTACRY